MSAIGPFPSGAASTVVHRDTAVQAAQAPGPDRQVHQGVRSELAQAVRQSESAIQAEKPVWLPVKAMTDKQGRLVGPPPTFEVNVLETLRAAAGNDTPDTPLTRNGYSALRQIADLPGTPVPELARRF